MTSPCLLACREALASLVYEYISCVFGLSLRLTAAIDEISREAYLPKELAKDNKVLPPPISQVYTAQI